MGLRNKPQRISDSERMKVKYILGISKKDPFPRCPGKGNTCKKVAGWGTRGDFYGLGEHIGHYGAGFCCFHERNLTTEKAWAYARRHMEAFKAFGRHALDGKTYEELAKIEAKEVEKYDEIRRGMDLVLSQLKDFEKKVKDENLTEWVPGPKGAGAMLKTASDVTRMDLALRIAKTLSGIKLDDFRLSAHNYLHVDELTVRIPKEIALAKRMFVKLRDLLFKAKPEGGRDPIEQVEEEYLLGMKEIWKDAKSGEKR